MKYIEDFNDLEEGEYYHCVTYNDQDIIVQYLGRFRCGPYPYFKFSTDLSDENIKYVLEKVDNLRERRKKFE